MTIDHSQLRIPSAPFHACIKFGNAIMPLHGRPLHPNMWMLIIQRVGLAGYSPSVSVSVSVSLVSSPALPSVSLSSSLDSAFLAGLLTFFLGGAPVLRACICPAR